MAVRDGILLSLVVVLGTAGYSWVRLDAEQRLDTLHAIAAQESFVASIPAPWLDQMDWLVRVRLHRLHQWWGVFASVALAGGVEGWLWRRRQFFSGLHWVLWQLGNYAILLTLTATAVFLLWLHPLPTLWSVPVLAAPVLVASFASIAGFMSIR